MITTHQELDFLKAMVNAGLRIEKSVGVPRFATIGTIGQAWIESAAPGKDGFYHPGLSSLYAEANNPFGMQWFERYHSGDPLKPIECPSYEFIKGVKTPVVERFRHFSNLDDAVISHWALLSLPRYRVAVDAGKLGGWKAFVSQLGPCGYSTTPHYERPIIAIVEERRLYDADALLAYAAGRNPLAVQ